MADQNTSVPKLEFVPAILAAILVGGVLAIMFVLTFHAIPAENKDAFNIVFGVISGAVGTTVAFYFGSSKSSAAKDTAITDMAKSAVNEVTKSNSQQ